MDKDVEQQRKDCPYILREEDGQSFPIPDMFDTSRRILIDGQTPVPSKELTWGICTFGPKTALHKKHRHRDCEEVMYIISGKGIGGVGEYETELRTGDTIFVPENVEHWYYNPYDEPSSMIFLYTKPTLRSAGYSLESRGYDEIDHEKEYREEKFDK